MIKKSIVQKISIFLLIITLLFHTAKGISVFAQESPTQVPSEPKAEAPAAPPQEQTLPSREAPTQSPSSAAPSIPPNSLIPPQSQPTQTQSPANAPIQTDGSSPTPATITSSSPTPSTPQGSTGTLGYTTGNSSYLGPNGGNTGQTNTPDDPKNTNTGPNSTNVGLLTNTSDTQIANQNNADVNNKLNFIGDTGNNAANYGTLSSEIFTGNAQVTAAVMNKLNSNFTGSGGVVTFDVYNTHVGDIVFNWLPSNGFTSGNPNGSVNTSSGAVVENSVTGPNSTNIGQQTDATQTSIANDNNANITQDITVNANTGGNSASYTTGGGTVKTGDAVANANIFSMANTNVIANKWLIGFVNIFGNLIGNIVLPQATYTNSSGGNTVVSNTATGPNSTNIAEASSSATQTQQNTNSAQIVNHINVAGTTGNNDASMNTYGSEVNTGKSDVNVSENTVANTNASGDTVWLVIVNEMGKWVGYIVGSPYGAASGGNLPTASGNGSGTTSIGNNGTGPDSTNTASVSNASDITTSSQNTAQLVNNINVVANTGGNSAKMNTLGGSIQTGDAQANLNLFNMVNTNVAAKKFVALFINVLGNFTGSIVSPDGYTPNLGSSESSTIASTPDNRGGAGRGGIDPNNNGNAKPTVTQTPTPPDNTYTTDTKTTQKIVATNSDVDTIQITYIYTTDYLTQTNPYGKEVYSSIDKLGTRQKLWQPYFRSAFIDALMEYSIPLASKYSRGAFISPLLAKNAGDNGILIFGSKYEITDSWLVFVPIALLLVPIRRRYVFKPLRKYVYMFMEILL